MTNIRSITPTSDPAEIISDPLSDLNLSLLKAQAASLLTLSPCNRPLQVEIYRLEEEQRGGAQTWNKLCPREA